MKRNSEQATPAASNKRVPYVQSLDERVEEHLGARTETLHICTNAWALRHHFINRQTGEMIQARCDSWRCLYCGPRKVDLWRQLIKETEPVLLVTLTRAGKTMEEASRALTTWVQAMRRGSKGKGPQHTGARPAYSIEYFSVSEHHENFKEVGFHWHLLIKGVDFLAKEDISACWKSATSSQYDNPDDASYIVHVTRIRNSRAIGYVTKYLTKDITREEKGVRQVEREMIELGLDENGNAIEKRSTCVVEVVSKARRIRYSRNFFPESVVALRDRLFSKEEDVQDIERDASPAAPDTGGNGTNTDDREGSQVEEDKEEQRSSGWALVEYRPFTHDIEEYRRRKREVLTETLADRQANGKRLSRRLLSMWDYQRQQLRQTG